MICAAGNLPGNGNTIDMDKPNLRVEFHCHTIYSKDCLVRVEQLLSACRQKGIDRVVITDHNTASGAFLAAEIDPDLVIPGEEILTQKGELLAAYIKEEIPSGLSPKETIEILREQGAFISVAHPFDRMRKGHWALPDLQEIAPMVDAIEVFNARSMSSEFNQQAEKYAQENEIAGTVGSDAHSVMEVGRAVMLLPEFTDAASLKNALPDVKFETQLSSPLIHFTSRYAVWYKRLFKPQIP
jgi:predicted metal-dependent phosphoesterase TrpH